jgi:hypothetical protein
MPPQPSPSDLAALPDRLQSVGSDLDKVIKYAEEALNFVLKFDPLLWASAKALQFIWDEIVKAYNKIKDWIANDLWPFISGPWQLYDASNRWTDGVYHDVTDAEGQIDLSKTTVVDYWQGAAAFAYTQSVGVQKQACHQVADMISGIREALNELAIGLAVLYITVIAFIGWVIYQCTIGAAATATGVGAPAGLPMILAALLEGFGGAAVVAAVVTALTTNVAGKFSAMLQLVNDSDSFNHGHWPPVTNDLADGSMTNPDPKRFGKWHFKRQ